MQRKVGSLGLGVRSESSPPPAGRAVKTLAQPCHHFQHIRHQDHCAMYHLSIVPDAPGVVHIAV